MQIHDVQPGYGGLIVLSDRRGEQLPLEVGVPFLAKVLEREGERVLLSLAGRLLRCETALPLEPGTTVWLAVKEASPRRVALALVEPAAAPSRDPDGQPAAGRLTPAPAPAPASSATQALARAVHFLIANGLPATPEAVRSVAALLSGEPRLAETLMAVTRLLPPAAEAGALPADALPPGFLAKLQAALERVFFPPSPSQDAAALTRQADRLAEVVRRLGLDHEPRLAALLEQLPEAAEPPVLTPVATPVTTPWLPAVALAEDDLKGLLLLLRHALALPSAADWVSPSPDKAPTSRPDQDPGPEGQPAAEREASVQVPDRMPPAANVAVDRSSLPAARPAEAPQAQAAAGPAPTPAPPPSDQAAVTLERLARAVDETLHNLTGQRLLAPSQTGRGQERLQLYLQIPVMVGEQRHTAEIRLYREGGGRAKSRPQRPAALRVSCRLTTANLGPVRVDLALRPKEASEAHLFLGAEPVLALFRAHEPELRDTLGMAGLRLGRVSYSLLPDPPPPDSGRGPRGGPPLRLSAIDLRM